MNHIFCIHSSVVEHLGCFKLLAMTNKAAMKVVEHVPLWHGGASFAYIFKSGIAGSSGRSISNFLRNLQVDFKCLYQFTIPRAMEKCSYFSTSSPTCDVTCGFDLSHSDWYKVESQGHFDLHFSDH